MISRAKGPDRGSDDHPSTVRELPHNLELERAVLAVLLDGRHATAMHKARQAIPHPLAFFARDHRIVYLACLELDDQGQRVDAGAAAELLSRYDFKSVIEKLKQQELLADSDQLDSMGKDKLRALLRKQAAEEAAGYEDSALAAIGGFNAVSDLAAAFAPAASLDRNLQLAWDYYLKRRLIVRLQDIADKAYRTPDSFSQLLETGSQTVLELGRMTNSAQVHGIGTVADETWDRLQHDWANPNEGVKTGIADLDQKLMALRPGGLYVLAARPGAGKTSFALSVVSNIASRVENPMGVLFFSLEVDRVDLAKKLLSAHACLDFRKIETGLLDPAQQEVLYQSTQALKSWNLDLMDVSDLNVLALRSVVKRRMLETNGGLKLIVLDYLQLLNGSRPDLSEYEKVSEISRVLKVLAREMRIPVVALSQMSRDSEKGVNSTPREPRLSDLRGSGTIEQDADAVIFIHRADQGDEQRRHMKIIIAKNRFGPTGQTNMHFFPATMRFEQAAEEYHSPDEDEGGPSQRPARMDRLQSLPSEGEDVF
jgi:replicative DNA helicase